MGRGSELPHHPAATYQPDRKRKFESEALHFAPRDLRKPGEAFGRKEGVLPYCAFRCLWRFGQL